MNRKEEIVKIMNFLRQELYEIEDAEQELERKKYDGKHFKFRNPYSCPEKDSDYWWVYYRVFVKDDELFAASFETDSNGEIKIRPCKSVNTRVLGGCVEISETEYVEKYEKLLHFLTYGDE